jgi:hypothetical protein
MDAESPPSSAIFGRGSIQFLEPGMALFQPEIPHHYPPIVTSNDVSHGRGAVWLSPAVLLVMNLPCHEVVITTHLRGPGVFPVIQKFG